MDVKNNGPANALQRMAGPGLQSLPTVCTPHNPPFRRTHQVGSVSFGSTPYARVADVSTVITAPKTRCSVVTVARFIPIWSDDRRHLQGWEVAR
jgi:hypothetical protein